MGHWDLKLLRAEVGRVLPLAAGDDDLRQELRSLAREILESTESRSEPPVEPLHRLTLGQAKGNATPPPRTTTARDPSDSDVATLQAIVSSCLRKEATARALGNALRAAEPGTQSDAPLEPWGETLRDRLYWSTQDSTSSQVNVDRIDAIAGGFKVLAGALALATTAIQMERTESKALERVLPLLAEAQAGLRAAMAEIDDEDEAEQIQAFEWTKETASRLRLYLKRHMRADDRPDPRAWADRLRRIERLAGSLGHAPPTHRKPQTEPDTEVEGVAPTAEVEHIARLLSGRGMLLIGGQKRRNAQERIRDAFGLKELYWLETKEHQSVETFEPMVARDDVAVVLLAIRWASHSFGEVKTFCEQFGKPLVRLPAGLGPNQVAAQILAQCGDRLSGQA